MHLQVEVLTDQLRGLVGAGERRGHQHGELQAHVGELLAGGACLLATGVIERNVGDALHQVRLVPVGLAVTNQGEGRVLGARRYFLGAQLRFQMLHNQAVDCVVQVLQGHLGQGGVYRDRVDAVLVEQFGMAFSDQGGHGHGNQHAVRGDHNGLTLVFAADAVQRREGAGEEVLLRFHIESIVGLAGGEDQLAGSDLPFQVAKGTFLEAVNGTAVGYAQAFGYDFGAFYGAGERRGDDSVHGGAFSCCLLQGADSGADLFSAGVVEGDVGAALEAVVDIPVGLAVAQEDDAGSCLGVGYRSDDGGVLCVGHLSSMALPRRSSRGARLILSDEVRSYRGMSRRDD